MLCLSSFTMKLIPLELLEMRMLYIMVCIMAVVITQMICLCLPHENTVK